MKGIAPYQVITPERYKKLSKSIGCSKSVDQSFSINAVMLCRMFEEKMEGASHTSYNKNDHKQH